MHYFRGTSTRGLHTHLHKPHVMGAKKITNPCIKCKHVQIKYVQQDKYFCELSFESINSLSGKDNYSSANEMRKEEVVCGPEGKQFQLRQSLLESLKFEWIQWMYYIKQCTGSLRALICSLFLTLTYFLLIFCIISYCFDNCII